MVAVIGRGVWVECSDVKRRARIEKLKKVVLLPRKCSASSDV